MTEPRPQEEFWKVGPKCKFKDCRAPATNFLTFGFVDEDTKKKAYVQDYYCETHSKLLSNGSHKVTMEIHGPGPEDFTIY